MSSQGSSKGSSKGSDFMSRTGSSRGVYKRNGEVMAIPFPTQINEALLNENKPYSDNSTMNSRTKGAYTLTVRLQRAAQRAARPFQERGETVQAFLPGSERAHS